MSDTELRPPPRATVSDFGARTGDRHRRGIDAVLAKLWAELGQQRLEKGG